MNNAGDRLIAAATRILARAESGEFDDVVIEQSLKMSIEKCGDNHATIAAALGINEVAIERFVNGDERLTLTMAARLANYFGMNICLGMNNESEKKGA